MDELKADETQLRKWLTNTKTRSHNYPRWYRSWFQKRTEGVKKNIFNCLIPDCKFCDDWRGPEIEPENVFCEKCKVKVLETYANDVWVGSDFYEYKGDFGNRQVITLCKTCLNNFLSKQPPKQSKKKEEIPTKPLVCKVVNGIKICNTGGAWYSAHHFDGSEGYENLFDKENKLWKMQFAQNAVR